MKKNFDVPLRRAKNGNRLTAGLLLLAVSILMLINRRMVLTSAVSILFGLLLILGGTGIVGWLTQKPRKWSRLLPPLLSIAFAVLIALRPKLPLDLLAILYAAYLLLNGIAKAVDAILIYQAKSGEFLSSLVPCLLYLAFGLLLALMPNYRMETVMLIIAIHGILYGATCILDFIHSVIPVRTRQKIKRKIRFSLPVILAMFIPYTIQKRINRFLSSGNDLEELSPLVQSKDDGPPDLEVFIHVAQKGFNAIGHCDICFDGEVIAYGNYDEAASLPVGIGPGVLLLSKKEQYIPFCLKFNHTTIFSFGLRLTEEQKERVRARIAEIKKLVYPWDPPYQAALKQDPAAAISSFRDFSSHLGKETDSSFYKFTGSKFKTYFVMTTNCVLLADSIVCKAGTDILNISGIISPGTFYDYLDTEFLRKGSMVISRDIYRLRDGELYSVHEK